MWPPQSLDYFCHGDEWVRSVMRLPPPLGRDVIIFPQNSQVKSLDVWWIQPPGCTTVADKPSVGRSRGSKIFCILFFLCVLRFVLRVSNVVSKGMWNAVAIMGDGRLDAARGWDVFPLHKRTRTWSYNSLRKRVCEIQCVCIDTVILRAFSYFLNLEFNKG